MFSDKLNFIMNITYTQACALGKVCNLAPSYISRMRNGSRPLPKKAPYLGKMAGYLAGRITTDYQINTICDAMKISSFPANKKLAADLVAKWLIDDEESSPDIFALLESFSSSPKKSELESFSSIALPEAKSFYYGTEGKREAVLQFFNMILKEKEPQTLLLSSEEEMGWLNDDRDFSARWTESFTKVLMAGNRVKIIHNIGRGMNEMLEAVSRWIPVYTTGMIEPYYYPKLRDGVFRRTLFIAPNTAAVVSASVEQNTDGMLNLLVTDRDAISACVQEYDNYLSLCRPLMNIITARNRDVLWEAYHTLLSADGDTVCMSDMPTLITMPEQVAVSMQERAPESYILREWQFFREFAKKRRKSQYTEILPHFKGNISNAPLPCAEMLGAPGLCYTSEEWNAHVAASEKYAARHKWYSQTEITNIPKNICLLVKSGRGVIMTKSSAPSSAFAFSEANMVSAFTDYMRRIAAK